MNPESSSLGAFRQKKKKKKNQLSISLSEIKGLLIEASHSLSVKEEQPCGVQGHVDDGGDVKAVGQRGGSGVQPVVGAPAGGNTVSLLQNHIYIYTHTTSQKVLLIFFLFSSLFTL